MGSTASTPEQKIFTPQAPIDFSASFLSQLENSQESDYSRSQYTEKYIQDRVKQELTKLEAQTIKSFRTTLNNNILANDDLDNHSVAVNNDKIQQLKQLLKHNLESTTVVINDDVKHARQNVIACLKDNEGKSLNCWDEVQKFKTLIKDL